MTVLSIDGHVDDYREKGQEDGQELVLLEEEVVGPVRDELTDLLHESEVVLAFCELLLYFRGFEWSHVGYQLGVQSSVEDSYYTTHDDYHEAVRLA